MTRSLARVLFIAALAMTMMLSTIASAIAVTDGALDGDAHPAVVLLLMDVDNEPAFRCTGTLLTPTILLTAGHCAGAPGEFTGMRVFYESDVEGGRGVTNDYPNPGPGAIEATNWASHPLYPTAPFFVHDVGIVELSAPVPGVTEFGQLPSVDAFDAWKTKRGQNNVWFTSVGYGVQQSFPDAAAWKEHNVRTRMVAYPHLIQINTPGFTGDFSLLLSNNAHTGGTCYGDSGGPNFVRDSMVVAGVTSFGLNPHLWWDRRRLPNGSPGRPGLHLRLHGESVHSAAVGSTHKRWLATSRTGPSRSGAGLSIPRRRGMPRRRFNSRCRSRTMTKSVESAATGSPCRISSGATGGHVRQHFTGGGWRGTGRSSVEHRRLTGSGVLGLA